VTQLGIKVYQPYARGSIEAGAILTLRLLADPDGNVIKTWWSEERPVAVIGDDGQSGDYATFDLPRAGYYAIEITPPRGVHISREVLVEEGEFRKETVTMESSPHEYLGWQQYAGILQRDPYDEEASKSGEKSFLRTVIQFLVGSFKRPVSKPSKEPKDLPTVTAPMLDRAGNRWLRGISERLIDFPELKDALPRVLNWPVQADLEFVTWFPPMPSANDGAALVNSLQQREIPPYSALDAFPRWICFAVDGQVDLASVPWAWFGMSEHRAPGDEIRFLYDRLRTGSVDRRSAGYLNLSIQDQRWFGLLQFLASDRMNRAGELVQQLLQGGVAEEALMGKVKGPLAAVAGGIVLVTQAKTTDEQEWDQWLKNLTNWFPGIPDGAILLGSRALQRATTSADLSAAFQNLQEGYSRGIPYFSATIRILDLTLAQISNDIPEAETLRQNIAFVASRVDPTQPFPVIRLRNPL
jgi:hypothetical protein